MVRFDQLMLPLMKALVNLGGSGSIDEIYEEVVELENFDEETLAALHNCQILDDCIVLKLIVWRSHWNRFKTIKEFRT